VYATWMGVYLGLSGEYVKTIYYLYPTHKLDNYLILNARIAYSFLERYQVFLNLNNLTDKEYVNFMRCDTAANPSNAHGYSSVGFNWMLGASAEF